MSTVCILISAFGIFSFVTLSCEQCRKEISVRKVNGATMKKYTLHICKRIFNFINHFLYFCLSFRIRIDEALVGRLRRTNKYKRMDILRDIHWYRIDYNSLHRLAGMAGNVAESGGSDKE